MYNTAMHVWKDQAIEAYRLIRNLYRDLGLDEERFGTWEDVPIIKDAELGVKRKAGANLDR